jgi:pimeloyl-ACP methyl ester carboxylesterase
VLGGCLGHHSRIAAALGLLVAIVALALPSAAAADYVAVKGAPAPGPAKYDRVWVQRIGPPSAKHVLVLVPGTQMGAGSVGFPGRAIQAELGSGWQVWAEDRREAAFVDRRGFAGSATAAKSYYLHRYHPVTTRTAPFARKWGLKVALNDLREVIKRAGAGGRSVVLGGHSLGAQEAVAYAAWDFNGHPGYQDLRGLVLIDGGEMGAFSSAIPPDDVGTARDQRAGVENHAAFEDVTRSGRPWIASTLAAVAGLYARKAPTVPSALAADPVVPNDLRPPFRTTNAGFLGNMFDDNHSRPGFESLRAHVGDFAAQGDPRPWVDGENASIARLASALSQSKPTFADWNFPRRLSVDANGADSMAPGPVTNLLGLRVWHTPEINVPLYAYQTDLTSGGVLAGAQRLKDASRIPQLVAVDDSANASHLDPLIAPPQTNRFIQTVVPFLRSIG